MQEKENAAARLLRAAEKARSSGGSRSTGDVWAEVFGVLSGIDELERHRQTAEYMSAMMEELRAVDVALGSLGVPDHLFKQHLGSVRHALSVGALGGGWTGHGTTHISPEVLASLRWMAYVLPAEEHCASAEALAEISDVLDELEALLDQQGVPSALASIVRKQVAAMRRAIDLYPVQGVAALRRAGRTVVADINIDQDEIRAAADTGDPSAVGGIATLLKKAWTKTTTLAGDFEKLQRGAKVLVESFEAVQALLPAPGAT